MAAPLQNFLKRTQARDGSPRFSLTLSGPALALVGAVVIAILGWSFFMGFMVGRGQNPEEHMDEIAQMFQSEERAPVPEPATPAGEGQGSGPEAVKPGDFQPGATPVPGMPAGVQPGAQALASQSAQAGQPAQAPRPAPQAQAVKPATQSKKEAQSSEPVYFFNYRLAAVKSLEAAQQEQKRYKAKGFASRIVKLGKGQALVYTLSGTDKDDAEFRKKLKAAGLGAPQLLSKTKK